MNKTINIDKLTPHIGAEITGIDLSKPLEPEQVKLIESSLMENQVVFFRDQEMTLAEQVRLGGYFGKLYTHPAAQAATTANKQPGKTAPMRYVSGVEGYPEIIKIYADANSEQVAGEVWHADVTSETEPPMGSILRITQIPPLGGDTLFASMYAAFEALSKDMQRFLCSLTAIHDGIKVYGGRNAYDSTRQYPRNEHPVVRTHPVTGRQALYVSTTFTTKIVQLSQSESDALLAFLFHHLELPMFQCRFRWRNNSMAFWDNRCVQHQAQWDYFPHTRIGYRVQITGDRPFHKSS